MSNSSWQHLDHSEDSNVRYGCRNESFRTRSAMTGLVPRQTRSPSAITFQTASRTGHSGIQGQPAHGNPEQLEPRIPKHDSPSEQRAHRARKRAFDSGPNDTEVEDPRLVDASKSWSNHFQDQTLPAARKYLNTPQTYDGGAPKLFLRHDLSAVVGILAQAVLNAFLATKPESEKTSTAPYRSHFPKRARVEYKETGNVAVHSDWEETGEALVEQPLEAGPKIWPCPFFIKDRKLYAGCLTRHCLLSMSDVRQHLILTHRLPLYCSICYKTFTSTRLRNVHMQKRDCVCLPLPPAELDGISFAQIRELEDQESTESKVTASQHEQWHAIWRTVFPEIHTPPSPVAFTENEFEVYKLRRFWKNNGKNIISDVLKERGIQDFVVGTSKKDLEVLYSLVVDRAAHELLLR